MLSLVQSAGTVLAVGYWELCRHTGGVSVGPIFIPSNVHKYV